MQLENKLLKDDVTNKQKFIDTLQHNSKLSQNFDIGSIISVSSIISVALSLLQTRQGSNHMKGNITRKMIQGLIIDKNKKKITQVRKVMKKMEVTKKKNTSSEKDSLPKGKSNKNIYNLGDSMVKHVEGWKLKKSIDKNHNVYVRSFSGAKVKCMKDYVKPCIREKKSSLRNFPCWNK